MRARLTLVLLALSISATAVASQVDAAALDEARKLIADKKFEQAAAANLAPAADAAAAIADDSIRKKAFGAVHFDSAVACSGAGGEIGPISANSSQPLPIPVRSIRRSSTRAS